MCCGSKSISGGHLDAGVADNDCESDKIEVENRKLVEQARATGEEDEA
jgi:hypothetical protein